MERKLLYSPAQSYTKLEAKQTVTSMKIAAGQGHFEGYASFFNLVDLGNDMVMPGAFSDSLVNRRARGVKMLWQHNAAEPIGVWLSIEEDSKGLKVSGRLNFDVARAREVHSLMREGSVDGLSIGFRTVKSVRDRKSGLRRLEKLVLWEISVVTFPMLPQARVNAVKRGQFPAGGIVNRADIATSSMRRALSEATNFLR